MTRVKICGLRREEDVKIVNSHSPDYCGFILSQGFKRTVEFNDFLRLVKSVKAEIQTVGVFVNEPMDSILKFAEHLDVLQLHGDEDASYATTLRQKTDRKIIKAIRAKSPSDIERFNDYPCDYLLIDAYKEGEYGGTGKVADWGIIKKAKISKPFFLAGGISAENVSDAINALSPFCVDASSSVETDGFKDEQKVEKLISIIRKEERYE
ncbi:MAG: phosphoribosylanthranilate isomerase [Ruminococcus sp.]|nr:phosphoribosylanthranilate isomerase [Ruminococcus sp.]